MPETSPATPIDAVITWVNGADPAHAARRHAHMPRTSANENATNPHRWACSDELSYCLNAIANHAPWINHIYIVTDAQTPNLTHLPETLKSRLTIIDHKTLFKGHEQVLPTFNSMTIETMIWNIPNLAERFVYFNDDVFLTAPLAPTDVFQSQKPVLRGKWIDLSPLLADPKNRQNPAHLNGFAQINAAAIAGYSANHLFAGAHVVHPMLKSTLKTLYKTHHQAFAQNITHRFRCTSQFLPQSLHNHALIKTGACVLKTTPDHLHLKSTATTDLPRTQLRHLLRRALTPDIKFLCINDLPQLEAALPHTRKWLERAIAVAA